MEKRKTVETGEVVQALREVAFGEASDESGASVKLASKLRALELLGKHLGMFDGNGNKGPEPVRIVEIEQLTVDS